MSDIEWTCSNCFFSNQLSSPNCNSCNLKRLHDASTSSSLLLSRSKLSLSFDRAFAATNTSSSEGVGEGGVRGDGGGRPSY